MGHIAHRYAQRGWNWSTSGDLSINGTMLEMNGQNGQLMLDLPLDAPPMRHYFNQSEESQSNTELYLSAYYKFTGQLCHSEDDAIK